MREVAFVQNVRVATIFVSVLQVDGCAVPAVVLLPNKNVLGELGVRANLT